MSLLNRLRKRVRWLKRQGRMLQRSVGHFRHRGIRIVHPGVLVDQPAVAQAIDEAVELAVSRGALPPLLPELLGRIVLVLSTAPIWVGPKPMGSRASWQGGVFDLGVARVQYDQHWRDRTRLAIALLLVAEGRSREVEDEVSAG